MGWNSPWSSQVLEGLCLVGAKTANARSASHTNDDISRQPAALQDGGRSSTTGEDHNGWWDVGSLLLTRVKQASKQRNQKESPTPTKFKVLLSARKVMATMFWNMKGVLLVEFQEQGRTVNAASYCSLLEWLQTAIRNKWKGLMMREAILLHANTRRHTSWVTVETVDSMG